MIHQRYFRHCCLGLVSLLTSAQLAAHPGATDAAGCHEDTRTHKTHCHSKRPAQFPLKAGDEGVFTATLRWVTDGDTLIAHVNGRDMEIRLADIDAPERDQPFGWDAKLTLIDVVRGQSLLVAPFDVDRYGRVIAHVYVGAASVGLKMVDAGAAWFYAEYANDDALYQAEQLARRNKKGLWALPARSRIEPWEWRRQQREAAQNKAAPPLK